MWAGIAPTSSSIFRRSSSFMPKRHTAPPTAPITTAQPWLTMSGPAVIATRPAIAPLSDASRSTRPKTGRERSTAASTPAAPVEKSSSIVQDSSPGGDVTDSRSRRGQALHSNLALPVDRSAMDRARTNEVKISPTFRVVIPENVRKTLGLKAGQRLHVLPYRGRIALVPVRETREMRGFQRGMDTRFEREPEHEV